MREGFTEVVARVVADADRRNELRCSKWDLRGFGDGERQELRSDRATKFDGKDSASHPRGSGDGTGFGDFFLF